MKLSDYAVGATIAVSDMDRAKEFYEGKLGLSGGEEVGDGGVTYPCAGETSLHVYPSPDNAGKSAATLAGFSVGDVEAVVDGLISAGVTFEQYDQAPLVTDEKGIVSMGDDKIAFLKDPDGNTLAIG